MGSGKVQLECCLKERKAHCFHAPVLKQHDAERERAKQLDSQVHSAVWVRCASYCEEQHAAVLNGISGEVAGFVDEEAEIIFPNLASLEDI